jgi:hypothetical protein
MGQYPTVLSLDELTGQRGVADNYMEVARRAIKNMGVENGRNFITLITDNPTVMQVFHTKFGTTFHWVLVSLVLFKYWHLLINKFIDISLFPA